LQQRHQLDSLKEGTLLASSAAAVTGLAVPKQQTDSPLK
jgi:hypothetical protein